MDRYFSSKGVWRNQDFDDLLSDYQDLVRNRKVLKVKIGNLSDQLRALRVDRDHLEERILAMRSVVLERMDKEGGVE